MLDSLTCDKSTWSVNLTFWFTVQKNGNDDITFPEILLKSTLRKTSISQK